MIKSLLTHPLKYLANFLQSLMRNYLSLKPMISMMLDMSTAIFLEQRLGNLFQFTATTNSNWLASPGWFFLALG